jgi:hypothetical protein
LVVVLEQFGWRCLDHSEAAETAKYKMSDIVFPSNQLTAVKYEEYELCNGMKLRRLREPNFLLRKT